MFVHCSLSVKVFLLVCLWSSYSKFVNDRVLHPFGHEGIKLIFGKVSKKSRSCGFPKYWAIFSFFQFYVDPLSVALEKRASERPKQIKSVSAETEISAKLTESSAEISAETLHYICSKFRENGVLLSKKNLSIFWPI